MRIVVFCLFAIAGAIALVAINAKSEKLTKFLFGAFEVTCIAVLVAAALLYRQDLQAVEALLK